MKPAVQAVLCALFSAMPASGLCAAAKPVAEADGKVILQSQCGRCHSIEKIGNSPLGSAPPLREIYRRYPLEQLEFELSEGGRVKTQGNASGPVLIRTNRRNLEVFEEHH